MGVEGFHDTEEWVKLKADYIVEEKAVSGFGDSVDVVIIGAKFGRGNRSASFGSFLCAVREEDMVGAKGNMNGRCDRFAVSGVGFQWSS